MGYINPTVDDFKTYFARAFPFSSDPSEGVTDTDIAQAYQLTNEFINETFFKNQGSYNIGYFNLAAHYLVTAIQVSGAGLYVTGAMGGIETSKSVGSVSQSFQIPEIYLKNPMYASFTGTPYGLRYLQMISPYMIGRMAYVRGSTRP